MIDAEQRTTPNRRALILGAVGAVAALTQIGATVPAGTLPPSRGIYLLGDSWAAGLHADPTRALGQVAADILGAKIAIDAVSGTGYVNTAGAKNYLQRASTATGSIALVVVQGGSNDQAASSTDLRKNAAATWATLRHRFPAAELLALGPGPDPEPVTDRQRAVDATLEAAARANKVDYVSMLRTHWIPAQQSDAVIDPDTHHPTIQGQTYLGTRLAASVRLHHPSLFDPPA